MGFDKTFLNIYLRSVARKMNEKKTPEMLKKELLEVFEEEDLNMNEEIKNTKEVKDGISLVKKYEDLLKGANRKIINIVWKQGELLKRFKDYDKFFNSVGLSRSSIYFKTSLYKFLCKFPVLKNLTLTSSCFESNFKNVCSIILCIFYPCLDNFV